MALLSAHRGGPEGTFAPNALATIAAACELGVDLVEFDVRVDSDGVFVIGHDGPSTVLLSDVLELIRGRARGHVDLKIDHGEIAVVDRCIEVLGVDGFVVTSRYEASIARLRTARPDVVVGLSLGRAEPWLRWGELFPWRRLERCGANLVAPHYRLARFGVLAGAVRRGLPVLVWTLNTEPQLRRAQRDPRIWAYTTDYPRLARQLAASE